MANQAKQGGAAIFEARRRRAAVVSGQQLVITDELAPPARQNWNTDHWETPWPVVWKLERELGPFDLDPAATADNAKAPRYYTEAEDGLRQPWAGRVFCNPPYSVVDVWIRKAIEAADAGALVAMLLPVRTDRDWWHDLLQPRAEIRFLRGRQRFIGPDGSTVGRPVFASCIAVLRPPRESPVSRLVTLYNLLQAHEGAPVCGATLMRVTHEPAAAEAPAVAPPSFEAMMAVINRRGRRRG